MGFGKSKKEYCYVVEKIGDGRRNRDETDDEWLKMSDLEKIRYLRCLADAVIMDALMWRAQREPP